MKVIIVGAHREAKELINRISSGWNVSVIDIDQNRLRKFTTNRQIEKIQGDGTSNLVLKKAGIEKASAVITLTLDDEINIEILKIAKQYNILRLSSVINLESNSQLYKDMDVEVVKPDILIARRFEHILEPRRVVSQAFAGGRAEAIEIEIGFDSPVRGKSLKEIGSEYFIVGALFRKGNVIIPHGDTQIETGDLVTIVLQSGAFSKVINLFSGSESRFPLEFGKNILVVLDEDENLKNLSESEFFTRNTKATSINVLTKTNLFDNNIESIEETLKAVLKDQEFSVHVDNKISIKDIEKIVTEDSIGTIFYPIGNETSKTKIKSLINLSQKHKTPVLFSKLTYPYKTIGILVTNDFDENSAASAAFDLAFSMSAKISAVNIIQPKFLQHESSENIKKSMDKLHDFALSHDVQLDIEQFEGNQAKVFSDVSQNFDLSVIGTTSNQSWQDKKIVEFVSKNSKSSILFVPK